MRWTAGTAPSPRVGHSRESQSLTRGSSAGLKEQAAAVEDQARSMPASRVRRSLRALTVLQAFEAPPCGDAQSSPSAHRKMVSTEQQSPF